MYPRRIVSGCVDLALAVAFVALAIALSHAGLALVDLINAPAKAVCINPATGLDDAK